jgi:hypothetical protein
MGIGRFNKNAFKKPRIYLEPKQQIVAENTIEPKSNIEELNSNLESLNIGSGFSYELPDPNKRGGRRKKMKIESNKDGTFNF